MGQIKKENSHRSHQKSGFSQVSVRIIWAFFRHVLYIYVFRNSIQSYLKKKAKIRLIVWYIIHINIALKTGGRLTLVLALREFHMLTEQN